MKHGVLVSVVLAAALGVSGCSDDPPAPPQPAPVSTPTPTYDPALQPSAAVLALVPEGARTLTVTDFEQVRQQLGLPDLGPDSSPAERAAFWQRADAERPLLSPGMLRGDERRLERKYGFSQVDVAWEAHFFDEQDVETGWVLAFREGTDMAAVQRAVEAGAQPLAGADVDVAQRLVTSGTTGDPTASWAMHPETVELVGLPANATYVERGCVSPEGVPTSTDLDELETYAVQFEGTLATARLGADRQDLFTRMRLGADVPEFTEAFAGGVADPGTGRIGYQMTDPPTAAELALNHQLPFAACG